MYYAIVFLPLLGAIIAALIALAGARARYPGGPPDVGGENHAHGPVDESPARGARRSRALAQRAGTAGRGLALCRSRDHRFSVRLHTAVVVGLRRRRAW